MRIISSLLVLSSMIGIQGTGPESVVSEVRSSSNAVVVTARPCPIWLDWLCGVRK